MNEHDYQARAEVFGDYAAGWLGPQGEGEVQGALLATFVDRYAPGSTDWLIGRMSSVGADGYSGSRRFAGRRVGVVVIIASDGAFVTVSVSE